MRWKPKEISVRDHIRNLVFIVRVSLFFLGGLVMSYAISLWAALVGNEMVASASSGVRFVFLLATVVVSLVTSFELVRPVERPKFWSRLNDSGGSDES